MQFFHGTSNTCFEQTIKEIGLIPRGLKSGNFSTQGVDSNNQVVYLNSKNETSFHEYRAALANNDQTTCRLTIGNLDETKLRVDENYIDFLERGDFGNCPIDKRSIQANSILEDIRWRDSIEKVHLASFLGKIEPEKIINVEKKSINDNKWHIPELFEIQDIKKRLRMHDWFVDTYNRVATFANIHKCLPSGVTNDANLTEEDFFWNKKGFELACEHIKRNN